MQGIGILLTGIGTFIQGVAALIIAFIALYSILYPEVAATKVYNFQNKYMLMQKDEQSKATRSSPKGSPHL